MTQVGRNLIIATVIMSALAALALWEWPNHTTFESPSRAVSSFVLVLHTGNMSAADAILGLQARKLLTTADGKLDRARIDRFLTALSAREIIVPRDEHSEILEVGLERWPFPIPLQRDAGSWRFDSESGAREILARHIGENELATIQACKAFVDAEREYASVTHGGVFSYARRIASTTNGDDGLYWGKGKSNKLGPAFAGAEVSLEGGARSAKPFHGYYFRILTEQGPAANDGKYSYLAHGKMIGGYALIAYPARYRDTGVMTFIVNQDDIVFQKDLGPATDTVARGMRSYDPGSGWTKA